MSQGELLSLVSQTWRPGPLLPDGVSLKSSHLTVLPDKKVESPRRPFLSFSLGLFGWSWKYVVSGEKHVSRVDENVSL